MPTARLSTMNSTADGSTVGNGTDGDSVLNIVLSQDRRRNLRCLEYILHGTEGISAR